ncbi:hypothetical protein HXX76_016085 [Chlamydomonas incerta]|uniref:Uncharacterized protein n=1 Tax=Chlamydomonas incerta TaxID=51695 RepID=A0A835SL31_CHLIN|nr:hypothetical protein HXX76_016085 [Chlamydomonas incerta]|eukprot:KAG2422360.1 hypothetical protein HXX76_016085 [Chlamydomonas incerta]
MCSGVVLDRMTSRKAAITLGFTAGAMAKFGMASADTMVVLLAVKVGLLPLLMVGCGLAVGLGPQYVTALTLLTLCPAAATSFVLAMQYGRGVELVSLTNILGNIFLCPLIIIWLKILTALGIEYVLHDDIATITIK